MDGGRNKRWTEEGIRELTLSVVALPEGPGVKVHVPIGTCSRHQACCGLVCKHLEGGGDGCGKMWRDEEE